MNIKGNQDPRHNARRLALSALFCWLFNEPEIDECVLLSSELLETEEELNDKELNAFIINGVKQHLDEIDNIISTCAPDWPIDKISKVDLVILRVAVFELVFGKKAPVKVAIDEAVELAKEFGNDTSSKFINGVLGTVVEKHTK
jgi:N utilization substance protein B